MKHHCETLVQLIQHHIASDDTDDSDRMAIDYDAATPEGQRAIDIFLMDLCGYRMPSLRAQLASGEDTTIGK